MQEQPDQRPTQGSSTPRPSTPAAPPAGPGLGRVVTLVRGLCLVGVLMLVSLPASVLLSSDGVHPLGLATQIGLNDAVPTDAARWRAAAVTLLPMGAGLFALWQLWQLFARYRRGDVLSAGSAAVLGRFAWGVVALAAAQLVGRTLMSVALTLDNPPGQRELRITLASDDFVLLLLGAVLVAVARVMVEAARAAEENRAFV